jgi:tight adherence protein B
MSARTVVGALLVLQAGVWSVVLLGRMSAEYRLHRSVQAQLGLRPRPIVRADATVAQRSRQWLVPALSLLAAMVGAALIGWGGLVLGVVPPAGQWLHRRRRAVARAEALAGGLAPALQLVVDNLRVGRDLVSSLAEVADASAEPVRSVFATVVAETRLGVGVAEAMARQAETEDNRHLQIIASAIGLHVEHGGNLTEILTGVAETIAEEDRLRRSVATLTADGRYSARILMALPILVLAAFTLIDPSYAAPLVTEPAGRVLSAMAVVLGVSGWAWLRSLSSPPVVA